MGSVIHYGHCWIRTASICLAYWKYAELSSCSWKKRHDEDYDFGVSVGLEKRRNCVTVNAGQSNDEQEIDEASLNKLIGTAEMYDLEVGMVLRHELDVKFVGVQDCLPCKGIRFYYRPLVQSAVDLERPLRYMKEHDTFISKIGSSEMSWSTGRTIGRYQSSVASSIDHVHKATVSLQQAKKTQKN